MLADRRGMRRTGPNTGRRLMCQLMLLLQHTGRVGSTSFAREGDSRPCRRASTLGDTGYAPTLRETLCFAGVDGADCSRRRPGSNLALGPAGSLKPERVSLVVLECAGSRTRDAVGRGESTAADAAETEDAALIGSRCVC